MRSAPVRGSACPASGPANEGAEGDWQDGQTRLQGRQAYHQLQTLADHQFHTHQCSGSDERGGHTGRKLRSRNRVKSIMGIVARR